MNLIFFKLLPTIIGITLITGAIFVVKPREKEILKPREVVTADFPTKGFSMSTKGMVTMDIPKGFSMSTKSPDGIQGNRKGEVIITTSLPIFNEP